jgi:hypothetical protein
MARKKKFFVDAYWPREPKASGRDEDSLWRKEYSAKRSFGKW